MRQLESQGDGMRDSFQGQVDDKAGTKDGSGFGYRQHRKNASGSSYRLGWSTVAASKLQVLADHESDDGDRERDDAGSVGPQVGDRRPLPG
jgi:hypothetical protein